MAEAYNVRVAPHNCGSALSTAASVQLSACIANFMTLEVYPYFSEQPGYVQVLELRTLLRSASATVRSHFRRLPVSGYTSRPSDCAPFDSPNARREGVTRRPDAARSPSDSSWPTGEVRKGQLSGNLARLRKLP